MTAREVYLHEMGNANSNSICLKLTNAGSMAHAFNTSPQESKTGNLVYMGDLAQRSKKIKIKKKQLTTYIFYVSNTYINFNL